MVNYKGICLAAGLILGGTSLAVPAWAQGNTDVVLNPDVPLEYVVKSGDTLWDIAEYFLRDPWMWPELWNANPQVANPHLIYPGEVLYLVWVDGQPRLQREAPSRSGLVRRSPEVRRKQLEASIPTIPLEDILAFLKGPRVIDAEEFEDAPHVVSFSDERLMGSSEADAYVAGASASNGHSYTVFRLGQEYEDPDTGDTIGFEAIPVSSAIINKFQDVSSARLTESQREVRVLDRLLPASYNELETNFVPRAPDTDINGSIIAVYDGVGHIGQFQIVTINRGIAAGLEPGHVLEVMQRGKKVRDPKKSIFSRKVQLPDVDAGHLMIFKTFDRLSYGLIMRATRSIHVMDKVVSPQPGA